MSDQRQDEAERQDDMKQPCEAQPCEVRPYDVMTYREGAYVVDQRNGALVQVMGLVGPRVQVRRPGGGREWEVPPGALRLATRDECVVAGVRMPRCDACEGIKAERRAAEALGDRERMAAATVLMGRHQRQAHPCRPGPS
ncbi:hypothetical protein [Streptomyces sp. ISL-11]|uniref:hypothetical protein n=1 Tax=Streptomyces sp. ISL-11 TaxID=2819174 RepID=UPI001BE9F2D3|nr:hypothetical protein [Streptomyces sp. ISL-11]MBT2382811.1 hypothetical protein [Streptomyces sp. ISL-11]